MFNLKKCCHCVNVRFVNTLKKELGSTKTYMQTSKDEKLLIVIAFSLSGLHSISKRTRTSFLHCIGYQSFISPFHENQINITETFISMSQYLDDLLNIDNDYFKQIYPKELQLNKTNISDPKAPFLDLKSVSIRIISTKYE